MKGGLSDFADVGQKTGSGENFKNSPKHNDGGICVCPKVVLCEDSKYWLERDGMHLRK